MPDWVKKVLDEWLSAAGITSGRLFRRVNKAGRTWGEAMTEKVVWHVVREFARKAGIQRLAPHDLRSYAEFRIMPNRVVCAPPAGCLTLIVRHNPATAPACLRDATIS
jgi:integrase